MFSGGSQTPENDHHDSQVSHQATSLRRRCRLAVERRAIRQLERLPTDQRVPCGPPFCLPTVHQLTRDELREERGGSYASWSISPAIRFSVFAITGHGVAPCREAWLP